MATRQFQRSSLCTYGTKGKLFAFAVPAKQQVYLYNARAFNNTGGSINVGILARLTNPEYKLWQYTASGTTYAEVTSTIQAGTATGIFTTTNNDGFAVQGNVPFGMVGFTVSSTGSGGTYTYKYYNGTSFATLGTLEVPVYTSAVDIWIVFVPPNDWVVGGATGLNQSMYSILVQGTTAPASTVASTFMWVGTFLDFYKAVPNNASVQLNFPDTKPYVLNGGAGLIPYFSTADATNQFGAYYVIAG